MMNDMDIVKVSSTGQIKIPTSFRKGMDTDRLRVEMKGGAIILRPMKFMREHRLSSFSDLGRKAFEFWNNKKDDVYQKFYGETS